MRIDDFIRRVSNGRNFAVYVLLIVGLSFLSLGISLRFHFYRDDWAQLWYAVNYPEYFLAKSTVFLLHPGAAVEEFVGLKIFGMNPFLWQLWGVVIRVIASFTFILFVYSIYKSKYTAFLAGIFYAPSVIGIESIVGVSSHANPLIIIFFSCGFYLWVSSDKKNISFRRLVSALLLYISVWISPAKALPLLVFVPLWDISSQWAKENGAAFVKQMRLLLFREVIFLGPIFYRAYIYISKVESTAKINIGFSDIKNLLTSLGSLMIAWLIPFRESVSHAYGSYVLVFFGLSFIALLIFFSFVFIFLRKKEYRIYFLLFSLMFLAYFPNWMSGTYMMIGVSHRYLALSGLGLVSLLAILLSKVKGKAQRILILTIIITNIFNSNRILLDQYKYRSYKRINSIINQMDQDVAPNQKDLIFLFTGNVLRSEIFDMGGVPMFAFKRNITLEEDVPTGTADRELIKKLLCDGNVKRNAIHQWVFQENRIPLSHVYAWDLNDKGELFNKSERSREEIQRFLDCDYLN